MCSPIFTAASAALGTASAVHSLKQDKERRRQVEEAQTRNRERDRLNYRLKEEEEAKEKKERAELFNLRSAKSGILPRGSVGVLRKEIFEDLGANEFQKRAPASFYGGGSNPWKVGQTVLSNWSKLLSD